MSYPSASTPDPSVHQTPSGITAPFSGNELDAITTAIVDGILAQVLLAVANISIGSVKPFGALQGWAQELEQNAQNALTNAATAQTTANTANTNATSALDQLESLITAAGGTVIADVASAIETAKSDAESAAQGLENLVDGVVTGAEGDVAKLAAFIKSLLSASSSLNAANIIGQLFPQQIGPVSISSLANITPDLLAGAGAPAVVTADGSLQQQFSPVVIPVSAGQVLDLSEAVSWSGVTGGTDALNLMVAPYSGGTVGTLETIDQVDNPAASGSQTLSGSYTVPASGVDSIRVVASVNTSCTAGTVTFAAPSAKLQQQLIPQSFVSELEVDLSSVGSEIGQIADGIAQGIEGTAAGVGNAISTIETNLANMLGNFVAGLTGTTPAAATSSDVQAAAGNMLSTVSGLSASVNDLQTSQIPTGGTRVAATASGGASDWGSPWTLTGNGSVKTVNGVYEWSDSGNAARQIIGIYNLATFGTDYQMVAVSDWSLMESPVAGSDDSCGNLLIIRADSVSNPQNYVYARIYYNRVELGCVNAGVKTVWDTKSFTPQAGSLWQLLAGDLDSLETNVYRFTQGGVIIAEYTDSSNTANVGAGYRYGGQGMISAPRFTGESTPGSIYQFTMNDQGPVSYPGTSLFVSRESTSIITPPKSSATGYGSGMFDTTVFCSKDIQWGSGGALLPVGYYVMNVSFGLDTTIDDYLGVCLSATTTAGTNIVNYGYWIQAYHSVVTASFAFYADGQTIYCPAINVHTTAPNLRGEGTGTLTAMSIIKVGP